jgi:hypothetical protein
MGVNLEGNHKLVFLLTIPIAIEFVLGWIQSQAHSRRLKAVSARVGSTAIFLLDPLVQLDGTVN